MTDTEKIKFLKRKLQDKEAENLALKQDVRTTIVFVYGVLKELDIDTSNIENFNIGKILPGVMMKITTGSIDFNAFNLEEMKEIIERNKHLADGIE